MKLSKVLNENYKIYHKSFSSAARAAVNMAVKKGYEVIKIKDVKIVKEVKRSDGL